VRCSILNAPLAHSHNGFPDCGPEFQLRRTERNLLTWARAAYFCGAGGLPCLTCVRRGGGWARAEARGNPRARRTCLNAPAGRTAPPPVKCALWGVCGRGGGLWRALAFACLEARGRCVQGTRLAYVLSPLRAREVSRVDARSDQLTHLSIATEFAMAKGTYAAEPDKDAKCESDALGTHARSSPPPPLAQRLSVKRPPELGVAWGRQGPRATTTPSVS
jgi:hypothetical protein